MKYQNTEISKKESEWIRWYEKGENQFWNAYYEYAGRKRKAVDNSQKPMAWFNTVLKGLKNKGLFGFVPFAFYPAGGLYWVHPGFENSGEFKAEVAHLHLDSLTDTYRPIII